MILSALVCFCLAGVLLACRRQISSILHELSLRLWGVPVRATVPIRRPSARRRRR